MKYFIVSETKLYESGLEPEEIEQFTLVPEWATHFARKETDEEIESGNSPKMSLVYVEEIKK